MYCNRCGSELDENTNFCPNCGSPVNGTQPNFVNTKDKDDGNVIAILAIVFSVIMPLVGLIIALVCRKQYSDPNAQSKFKIAIIISSILLGISAFFVLIWIILFSISAMAFVIPFNAILSI